MFVGNNISIHAPTRGATLIGIIIKWSGTISIHAPTRGATITRETKRSKKEYFNPRSHERSDIMTRLLTGVGAYFNPRSHERSDHPFGTPAA